MPGLFAAGPQTVLTQQRQHLFEASVRQFVATLTGPRINDGVPEARVQLLQGLLRFTLVNHEISWVALPRFSSRKGCPCALPVRIRLTRHLTFLDQKVQKLGITHTIWGGGGDLWRCQCFVNFPCLGGFSLFWNDWKPAMHMRSEYLRPPANHGFPDLGPAWPSCAEAHSCSCRC